MNWSLIVNSFISLKYYLVATISNIRKDLDKPLPIIKSTSAKLELGGIYNGVITKITDFGAFVEFFPAHRDCCTYHRLIQKRVNKVTDVLKEGEVVTVKLIAIEGGKYSLSKKALLPETGP